ncbi:MAG: DUF4102 domain-containing protein, partial [Desulfobulbaceae bacterium]|nr:DUF4102 domain-containing protein [Desulfobulbaceae bacterium]
MPKMKFTAVSVKNLKPQPKSVEFFDTGREHGAGALGLRISPKNKRAWFLMYSVGTKVKRYSLGNYPSMTLKAARDEAINIMAKVNDGNDPQQKKQDSKRAETFAELWGYYLTAPGLGKKIKRFIDKAETTQREDRRKYDRHLKDSLGHMKLVDITRGDIKQVLESLSDKKHSANRLYALLSVLFKHADDKEWIATNPLPPAFGEPEEPRDRFLSAQEIKTIWPELTGQIGAIYKIIMLSGQRPGQVGGMRWSEIENDTWIIPKERVKNRKSQQVV